MQTLVLDEPGHWNPTDTPEPAAPGPGEAVVRVHRVGVCGTDIHAFRGDQPFFTYPRILGHELGVTVEALGPGVDHLAVGDRCAVEPYLNCGDCYPCRVGRTNCCVSAQCLGVHVDGGMRERLTVPALKLHRSDTLDHEALAMVEMLGIGKHAVSRAAVSNGETVAVLGMGPIGLGTALFAKLAGASVVGADVSGARLDTAQRLLGIDTLQLSVDEPLLEKWNHAFGEPPLKVFDATGNPASMEAAFTLPGAGGTLTLVGLVNRSLSFHDPDLHRREITVHASRNAVADDFRQIIAAMEAGYIRPADWITHRADAAEFPGVFESWLAPDAGLLKGTVRFAD